jgi:diguanylate cyclase (GGDEF)-like protein
VPTPPHTTDPPPPDLASLQGEIAEGILTGAPLATTAVAVCGLVERCLPGTRVAIRTGGRRRSAQDRGVGPSLPASWHRLFDVDGGPWDEAQLSDLWPAAACSWREDLRAEAAWKPVRRELRELGLAGCCRAPVLGPDGEERAVAYVYWPHPHRPAAADRRVMHAATVLLGLAVERHHDQRALVAATSRDPLTQLPNRSELLERLRHSLARARRQGTSVALLSIDLDHFQTVNDALGPAAGDRLLEATAARLTAVTRPEDTVARIGGDQFAVLSTDVAGVAGASALGARVADELRRPFLVAQRRFFLTASIGIALGGAGRRGHGLLRDAEVAMFRCKEEGRDRTELFDDRLDRLTRQRHDDQAALRRDLEDGAVGLSYEPVVDLSSGRPVGLETVASWRPPGGPCLAGRELLALAGSAGLLPRLGREVLGGGGRQLRALLDAGLVGADFPVRVKVEAGQLGDLAFPDLLADLLDRHRLTGRQLALDVTGAALADGGRRWAPALAQLRRLGVALWVDDFGTGDTRPVRVPALPVGGVKVDIASLSAVRVGPSGGTVLEAVKALADSLELPVVADRVEDAHQLEAALRLGIRAGQGPHLGAPVAASELPALLGGGGPGFGRPADRR